MNKYLLFFISIVLITFRTVSSNIEMIDKTESESTKASNSDTNDNNFRRVVNNLPGIQLGRLAKNFNRDDIEALRKVIQSSPHIQWQQFTAPPVEEPNCYVEVQVTQKIPGKCTKLGGKIPACQAQDLLIFDHNTCK